MPIFNRLTAVVLAATIALPIAPLQAKTKKGDKFLSEGRQHEAKKEWDAALEAYDKALSEDPAELVYQMAEEKAKFQAAQSHVNQGLRARNKGLLGEALLEFQKAFTINPGSAVASQELARTQEMIIRERKRVAETGKESSTEEKALTPADEVKKANRERLERIMPVPELRPLNPEPLRNLKISGQPVKYLFETIGKVAGINVLWDPDYQQPARNQFSVEFENASVEEALDYISVITRSYWKPLSQNAIFITNDNPNKRRDFAEMVAQTFYLVNVSAPQEIQEIVNAVRSIAEVQRVVAFTSQNAIIVRGEADQVALAAKMIHDLDKPRAEVVVDILVMEASSVFSRQLTAAIASTGLNVPFNFTPRSGLSVVTDANTTNNNNNNNSNNNNNNSNLTGNTGNPTSNTSGPLVPLSNLHFLNGSDFAVTLPSATLQAALSDTKTKVLQAPQLRMVDNVKASLKIGERQPTATGSFQPGIGGVGINPLVNTQFNFIDVGVNVDMQAHVHDNNDVSMSVDLDISTVSGHVNLGGIDQPIIGQRKVKHDVRMHDGEVSLLAGLTNQQDSKQLTGIPGLASIPLLGKLFSGESVDHQRNELMIVLIPHIVRSPEITAQNLRSIAVGNQQTIRLNFAPKNSDVMSGQAAAAAMKGNVPPPANAMPQAGTAPAVNQPAAATANPPATAPAAPPATAPPLAAPGMPPATAPPTAGPPATAPPAAPSPADQPAPAGEAHVLFSPAQVETRIGSPVAVSVMIDNGVDVASAPLQVQFDPRVLKLNDVTRGDFLASDGQQPVFTKNVLNESGLATIQLNRQPGTPGVNGGGVLVILNFQTVSRGVTRVNLPNLIVRNSKGQPVATGNPQLSITVQ